MKKPCIVLVSYRVYHKFGAGNEIRTRDLNLGKVALYQLSYSRITSLHKQAAILSETALLSRYNYSLSSIFCVFSAFC